MHVNKQSLFHWHEDKANLTVSYIVFCMRFDQRMALKQQKLFASDFFVHSINQLICEILHDHIL